MKEPLFFITNVLKWLTVLRVSHSKLSFDVHYDSIFLHFHSNYRDNVSEEGII